MARTHTMLGEHLVFFFFQAEDGIRDVAVTGVQTCALPISIRSGRTTGGSSSPGAGSCCRRPPRSEEHTSELQSRLHLVCRLLLEKKKKSSRLDTSRNRR